MNSAVEIFDELLNINLDNRNSVVFWLNTAFDSDEFAKKTKLKYRYSKTVDVDKAIKALIFAESKCMGRVELIKLRDSLEENSAQSG